MTKLPSLSQPMQLDRQTIDDFKKNGHVTIRNVLSNEEINAFRPVINEAAYSYNEEKRALADRDTYGKAFLQIMNLWEVSDLVKGFTLSKRLGKIAADLLGVDNVRIYHDQALYKEPGGGFTPWHQDQYYWPLDTSNTVTMWMPLINIWEEFGMLTFATGSHKSGFVENIPISDESEVKLEEYIRGKGFPFSKEKRMNAGDATWHYGWTLHCAPGNLSHSITREVMTIIYVADGAKVTKPINKNQENDRKRWLADTCPGAVVDSLLNPLVL